jgi:hypothetical protein
VCIYLKPSYGVCTQHARIQYEEERLSLYVCMYVWMDGWMRVGVYLFKTELWGLHTTCKNSIRTGEIVSVCMYVCMYGWMD